MQNTSAVSTVSLSGSTPRQNMKKNKSSYSNCRWLQMRFEGEYGHVWRKARIYQLLNKHYSKKLSWFNVDRLLPSIESSDNKRDPAVKHTQNILSNILHCGKTIAWADDYDRSLLTLLDNIVNKWQPCLIDKDQNSIQNDLHSILTPKRLKQVRIIYGVKGEGGEETALQSYRNALVPLHYHELWASTVRDYHSLETDCDKRKITIDNVKVSRAHMIGTEQEVAVIVGKTRVLFTDSFIHLNKSLSLFDLVIISIDQRKYFGVIVRVEQIPINESNFKSNEETIKVELEMNIVIYVSDDCGDAVCKKQTKTRTGQLDLIKVSNITSTARMISAIHKIEKWPRYLSLLRPDREDSYYQSPITTEHNQSTTIKLKGFNKTQRKIIDIAAKMFEDHEQDRLALVVGPPGTGKTRTIAGIVLSLLPKLFEGQKLLICAPSNNACDELLRRILDEFQCQEISCGQNMLVRIGGVPPDDENLCEYFHDFHVLKKIFELLREEPKRKEFNTYEIGKNIMKNARIILSTLNHCASSRMQSLKKHVDFIIIDEACQSLEADCLNAFRFGCTKIMLVGDPNQLPPTVMSQAGRTYGLNQSLYDRLYKCLKKPLSSAITMLKVQYRMVRDICEFPNQYFYNHELITPPSVNKRSRNFPLHRLYFYNLANSTEIKNRHGSKRNEQEALVVKELCCILIDYLKKYIEQNKCSLNLQSNIVKSIAIMTPYKDQIRCFQDLDLPPGIEVMTVDGAQGKEKDIIIYSCVRNNGEGIGFLNDKRRLNVALTRAREVLYVVGNLKQFARQPKNEFWTELVQYAQSNGRNIIEDVDCNNLQLPFIKKDRT